METVDGLILLLFIFPAIINDTSENSFWLSSVNILLMFLI